MLKDLSKAVAVVLILAMIALIFGDCGEQKTQPTNTGVNAGIIAEIGDCLEDVAE